MQQRIQKIMAHAGVASRRKCEALIEKGVVKVNGKTVKLGDKADPGDKITVNEKLIKTEKKVYIILNKPQGIICSVGDWRARKTVVDLIGCKEKIFPVGRLDIDSEGLMILTNDGDFANKIMHPSYNVRKGYLVVLSKPLKEEDVESVKKGVSIEGRKVNVLSLETKKSEAILSIHEGRKHIIKKLFGALGYNVVSLKRISIGKLKLELEPGEHRFVKREWLKEHIF